MSIDTEKPQCIDVPVAEHIERIAQLRRRLQDSGFVACCLFGSIRIFYFTGFNHIQTERPVALVIPVEKDPFALVPSLEEEHVNASRTMIPQIFVYPEYPGLKHPMQYLHDAFLDQGLTRGRVAVDSDGYGGIWGYDGPALSTSIHGIEVVSCRKMFDEMRQIKSDGEIALLKESAKLGNLAHGILQSLMHIGKQEIALSLEAASQTTNIMLTMFGRHYISKRWNASPAFAFCISGPKTSLPHALPGARKLQRGDVVVTLCSAEVGGYMAEMERTLFIGDPSADQKRYFELMQQAREVAFENIKPGNPCSNVDTAVKAFCKSTGCPELTRHHVGHGLGLEAHEPPFLDQGEKAVMQPGMVFSIEPGIYVAGLGGFRHSDTVVVTRDGMERITYYPTDIESLTIPN